MLTFLGVVSMMGSVWLGWSVASVEARGAGWWISGVVAAYISGMVACLVLAYLCFGGEF